MSSLFWLLFAVLTEDFLVEDRSNVLLHASLVSCLKNVKPMNEYCGNILMFIFATEDPPKVKDLELIDASHLIFYDNVVNITKAELCQQLWLRVFKRIIFLLLLFLQRDFKAKFNFIAKSLEHPRLWIKLQILG